MKNKIILGRSANEIPVIASPDSIGAKQSHAITKQRKAWLKRFKFAVLSLFAFSFISIAPDSAHAMQSFLDAIVTQYPNTPNTCGMCHGDWSGAEARNNFAVMRYVETGGDFSLTGNEQGWDPDFDGQTSATELLAAGPNNYPGRADKDNDGYITLYMRSDEHGLVPTQIGVLANDPATPPTGWDIDDNNSTGGNIAWGSNPPANYPADTTPPAAVTDLRAASVAAAQLPLQWTSPGDDGSAGTAHSYDIRYTTDALVTAYNTAQSTAYDARRIADWTTLWDVPDCDVDNSANSDANAVLKVGGASATVACANPTVWNSGSDSTTPIMRVLLEPLPAIAGTTQTKTVQSVGAANPRNGITSGTTYWVAMKAWDGVIVPNTFEDATTLNQENLSSVSNIVAITAGAAGTGVGIQSFSPATAANTAADVVITITGVGLNVINTARLYNDGTIIACTAPSGSDTSKTTTCSTNGAAPGAYDLDILATATLKASWVDAFTVTGDAVVTFQAAGTVVEGNGDVSPAWPTHQANDIALLIVESANESVTLSVPAGFVEVTNSPQGTGTAGSAGATRLAVFWARATSSSMGAPTVLDPGNHQQAQILTFRGAITTGNPWDVTYGNVASTASATVSIPGGTTTVANTLVVAIAAIDLDWVSTTQFSGWTNADLSSITERADATTGTGAGGGFGVATGGKAAAGPYGVTTATISSSVQGRMSIALKPPVAVGAGSLQFTGATFSVGEATASINLTVSRTGGSSGAVSVECAIDVGGTATGGGVDYTFASPVTLNWADADSANKNCTITIINDTLDEADETANFKLQTATGGAAIGAQSTTVLTITDNDTAPTVAFSAATGSGGEATTPANMVVTLSVASGQTVTVNYSATGGTATGGGTDYTLAAGTLTFSPGVTSQNVSATINNDTLDETNETIIVTLASPTNATLGAQTTHTYTITDDDATPTVAFSAATGSGGEATTPALMAVTLSAASGQTVTVNYSATGGTAAGGGTDYTLAAGTLTFSPGVTSQNVSATIVDDAVTEANETIIVTLASPTNATLGAQTTHTYTINDNDAGDVTPPTFSGLGYVGDPGSSGTVTLCFVDATDASGLHATEPYIIYYNTSSPATGGSSQAIADPATAGDAASCGGTGYANKYNFTITTPSNQANGVKRWFTVHAKDSYGNETTNADNLIAIPYDRTATAGYNMLGVSGELGGGIVNATIFGDDVTTYRTVIWNAVTQGYASSSGTVNEGTGYMFLNSDGATRIVDYPNCANSGACGYAEYAAAKQAQAPTYEQVTLDKKSGGMGGNIVSNPCLTAVTASTAGTLGNGGTVSVVKSDGTTAQSFADAVAAGYISGTVYRWNPGSSSYLTQWSEVITGGSEPNKMRPFAAYWVHVSDITNAKYLRFYCDAQ